MEIKEGGGNISPLHEVLGNLRLQGVVRLSNTRIFGNVQLYGEGFKRTEQTIKEAEAKYEYKETEIKNATG